MELHPNYANQLEEQLYQAMCALRFEVGDGELEDRIRRAQERAQRTYVTLETRPAKVISVVERLQKQTV